MSPDKAETWIRELAAVVPSLHAAVIVDMASGEHLAAQSHREDFDLVTLGACCRELVRQEQGLIPALAIQPPLQDVVLTFGDQVHVLKPCAEGVLICVVTDRAASLVLLRSVLQRLEAGS